MSEFDTIIIGAGIAGMSVAYELSKKQKVLVLEQEINPGYHSTGRSAAVYVASYKSDDCAIQILTNASWPMFKNPPARFTETQLYRDRGLLYIAEKSQLNELASFYDDLQSTSTKVEWVGKNFIKEKFPLLRDQYAEHAVYDTNAYDIDVNELMEGYRRGLRQSGGSLKPAFRVTDIIRKSDHWLVSNGQEIFQARNLVNAAGAWCDEIAKMAHVSPIGIQCLRRSAALINLDVNDQTKDFANWPMAVEFKESFYFKPDAGKLLVSPANEDPAVACDVQPEELDIAYAADFAEKALHLTVKRIDHSWAGLRNFVADRRPVIGFDPEAEGFFWLAGQGGTGVQTAPAAARLAASLILREASPRDLQDLGLSADVVSPSRL